MECLIWLDEALSPSFPHDLLNELLALSKPVGLGAIEADGHRNASLTAILGEAVRHAGHDHRGRRNWDLAYNFDYVAGYRIKVFYYEEGMPVFEDDDTEDPLYLRYRGIPVVISREFDEMYGAGALEGAVQLALSASLQV